MKLALNLMDISLQCVSNKNQVDLILNFYAYSSSLSPCSPHWTLTKSPNNEPFHGNEMLEKTFKKCINVYNRVP